MIPPLQVVGAPVLSPGERHVHITEAGENPGALRRSAFRKKVFRHNVRIRMFESKNYGDNNPLGSSTVGSISGLSAKGALLFLRFHTGMELTNWL